MVTILAANTPTVKTTGINIESVVTLVSSIVVLLSVIIGGFLRQQSKAINGAITNQTTVATSLFATKESVVALTGRIDYLEEKMADIVSNLKGANSG